MKLKLEDYVNYLPYHVNLKYDIDKGGCWELDESNLNALTEFDKLLLYPLSSLNKSEFKFLYNELDNIFNDGGETIYWLTKSKELDRKLPYNCFIKLLEYHFDVFDLISKGKAIDINTL